MKKPEKFFKILGIFLIAASLFAAPPVFAEEQPADYSGEIIGGYSEFYGQRLESGAGSLITSAVSPYADGFSVKEFLRRAAAGEIPLDIKSILAEAGRALFGRAAAAAKSMAGVLGAAVLGAFLSGAVSGFEKSGAFKAASYACLIAVVSIASAVFYECLVKIVGAVESLAVFMRCAVPVMIAALMSSGAVVSASALEAPLLAVIEISISLIKSLFLPLVMIGAGIGIVNSMSEKLKTKRLAEFINGFVKYGLSVLLMIFVAFAGLSSVAASGADALTLKLTKFASSNLIPLVGGILSDSVETVLRCGAVIKNALGVLGIVSVAFMVLTPIIEIAAVLIVFRLTAALCEPISSKSVTECLTCMADGIAAAMSMLISTSVMFIIMLTVMINISV